MPTAEMTHGIPLASTPLSPPLLLELRAAVLRTRDDEIGALARRGLPCAISAEDISDYFDAGAVAPNRSAMRASWRSTSRIPPCR